MPHYIVVGNEKGGAGKSTVSIHISTALARMGHRVAVLDLDLRQRSFGRFIENRRAMCAREGVTLAIPDLIELPDVPEAEVPPGENAYDVRLGRAVANASTHDFILIDCPGSHTRLSQVAHSLANTLVTPMNDSFVDFDMLARLNPDNGAVQGPSVYSEMVWHARQMRAQAGLEAMDWIVVRNRLGPQQMINKRKVGDALKTLSKRIGFRVEPGFSERVIFRELFPRGITLLDLKDVKSDRLSLSNIAARQEVRDLLKNLSLPGVRVTF